MWFNTVEDYEISESYQLILISLQTLNQYNVSKILPNNTIPTLTSQQHEKINTFTSTYKNHTLIHQLLQPYTSFHQHFI